jgi:hypothetical protein
MSIWRLACLATLAAGCTVLAPAGDYFDERGVETIAVAHASIDAMAIAGDRLYVAEGDTLYAKSVDDLGELVPVATATAGFANLTTDGVSVVAWCDGGAWYLAFGGPARPIPGSSRCAAISARGGVVAYIESAGANTVRRWDAATGTARGELVLPTTDPTGLSVGLGADGVVHVGSAIGLVRECQLADRGCEDGLCRLGSFSPTSPSLSVLGSGASARVAWFDDVVGELTAPVAACCPFAAKDCAADPLRGRRSTGAPGSVAVDDDRVFVLHDGSVKVVDAFADPTRDVVVAPAVLNARLLAVGGGRAVFAEGSRILRAHFALRP